MIGLDKLKVGEKAKVVTPGGRRLADLGLVKGTEIECVLESPLKDPKAYKIRGATIAIRKAEAKDIKVEVSNI